MGLWGQPVIIVLMDQHKSETMKSSVHSRSELRQGQCSELEPGLSELGRFRINALGFLFFFLSFFFFAHVLFDFFWMGWDRKQIGSLSNSVFRSAAEVLTQYCLWISIVQKQLWKAEGFAPTFWSIPFPMWVGKDSRHSPSGIHSLASLSRVFVRTCLPEVKLWQWWSMKVFLLDGHAGTCIELVCLAGHCTCCLMRKHYAIQEFFVRSLILD